MKLCNHLHSQIMNANVPAELWHPKISLCWLRDLFKENETTWRIHLRALSLQKLGSVLSLPTYLKYKSEGLLILEGSKNRKEIMTRNNISFGGLISEHRPFQWWKLAIRLEGIRENDGVFTGQYATWRSLALLEAVSVKGFNVWKSQKNRLEKNLFPPNNYRVEEN